tara:strand:+ start:994 stop:1149 length:156 start_codon:yes stop_codon:yes gene_type:complete
MSEIFTLNDSIKIAVLKTWLKIMCLNKRVLKKRLEKNIKPTRKSRKIRGIY